MKWVKPEHGADRVITRFLFLPRCLYSYKTKQMITRWLEIAKIQQTYRVSDIYDNGWEDQGWEDI